jgi:hypothetical protein
MWRIYDTCVKKHQQNTLWGGQTQQAFIPGKPLRGNGLTHHVNHHFPKRLLLLFRQVDEDITVRVLGGNSVPLEDIRASYEQTNHGLGYMPQHEVNSFDKYRLFKRKL